MVSGVDRSSPMGPQSSVQKAAATTTAMPESPVLWPYSQGSIICPVASSTTRNSRPEQHCPPGIDGECDDRGKGGGDIRADIGHETQEHPEDAPEYRMGHADEPQPVPTSTPKLVLIA